MEQTLQSEQKKRKKNFSPELAKLYRQLDPMLMPLIVRAARRLAPKIQADVDDLVQEARVSVAEALESYDYNRSRGGIFAFARQAVKTAMCNAVYKAASRGRTRETEDGKREWVPVVQIPDRVDWDAQFSSNDASPEEMIADAEEHDRFQVRFKRLKLRLLNGLKGNHAQVFKCLYHPDAAFTAFLKERHAPEPSNMMVAEYLGLSKNVIDWSVHKIKRDFTKIAEEELPEFVSLAMDERKWPMIYVSDRDKDDELVSYILSSRSLDGVSLSHQETKSAGASRRIVFYSWGVVLYLELDGEFATIVAEGRFNKRTGEVIGEGGHWKPIADRWASYPELERRLRKLD